MNSSWSIPSFADMSTSSTTLPSSPCLNMWGATSCSPRYRPSWPSAPFLSLGGSEPACRYWLMASNRQALCVVIMMPAPFLTRLTI